ncbi:DUF4439 domain-containing protein [Ornithinimicrobium cryptoxanthini]|uniref:DUF4439 domain-containing protein n=1 Tax=Ornithinimicrobium cryptoxanthini TaxID=2934161 RepID=UPI00211834E3|nr:DUF4439 domain-containing protein [Ornithinimicrobium cryptoxanthini]
MAAAITRRSLLAVMGAGLGAVLVGCDSEPTSPEATATPGPTQPDEPAASPAQPADTEVLLLALARARELADRCRAITGAEGAARAMQAQVQGSLDEQAQVLADVLRAGNVAVPEPTTPSPTPQDPDRATTTSTPTGDAATATSAPGDASTGDDGATGDAEERTSGPSPAAQAAQALQQLGRAALDDVSPAALNALAEVSRANLPMLIALTAQRGAMAHLFGQEPSWPDLTGPTEAAANNLLNVYRPAVYGFEVIAARSHNDERAAYRTVLGPLRTFTRQLTELAGKAAAPAPLGYGLPQDVDSATARGTLAGELMATLPPSIMAQTAAFSGDEAAVAGSVRLLADAVRLAQPWNPVTAFPGMRVPGA